MDDDDSENQRFENKREKINILQKHIGNACNVFSSLWLRRFIQINNGAEWFVLGCRYNFLLNFRIFLVVSYLFYQTIK